MTRVAYALCAGVAAVVLWRALAQVWVDEATTDAVVSGVLRLAIPAFSAAASALAIAAGFITARPRRFFALDAITWGVLLVIVFALTLGRLDRDYIGVLFVLALAVRIAPAVLACVADRSLPLVFATAFTAYAALAAWHQAAALPLGDQVHYLLVADRLAHGSIDATLDADLFRRLTTLTANDFDSATHVFNTPHGPREIQGYAVPLLLLPGWVAAGRFGAEVVVAIFAALAAVATALILRDTIASVRLRGAVWATPKNVGCSSRTRCSTLQQFSRVCAKTRTKTDALRDGTVTVRSRLAVSTRMAQNSRHTRTRCFWCL